MNRIVAIALVAVSLQTATVAGAQTPAPIAPPTAGMLVSYQYWPTQYIQWVVGGELPYSMFELDVDTTAKQPVYHVVLTGNDGTRTHYSNVDGLVTAYKMAGEPSYKADMAFEGDDAQRVGATATVRFTMADGKPLEWRFVQGSEVSEQGSGLTPLPAAPVPIFAYREQGALAGEGTALKIGEVVSTAEVWKEISHPPQFVAYRGAMTTSAHTIVLLKGKETWKIVSTPASLAAGSSWEMDDDRGDHRTLKIDKVDGAHYVLSGTDRFHPSVRCTLEATRAGDGWSVERVRYAPVKDGDKHFVTLQFATPLSAATTASNLDIVVGKKAKIATASMTLSGDAANRTETVKLLTPAWAAGKQLTEETAATAGTVTVTAQ